MRVLSEIILTAKRRGVGFVRDLFYIPKHGKLPEGTFLGRIALSITVIVGCLGAMALSAYAYFRADEVIPFGTLHSADYALEITADGKLLTDGKLQGAAGKTHTVTLTKGGSAQTGFCVITVRQEGAADVVYHTQQIGADQKVDDEWTEQITFVVIFNSEATLIFEPHWGTSSNYQYVGYEEFVEEPQENSYIVDKEKLTVAAIESQGEETTTPDAAQTATATTVTTATSTATTSATTEATSTTTAIGESTSTANVTEETAEQTEESSSTTSEMSTEATATETTEVNATPEEEN